MAVMYRYVCRASTQKCLGMQLQRIQHVDLSGLQTDSASALTSSGKYSITDVYDVLRRGQDLKRRRLHQCNSFSKTANIKVEFH